MRGTQTGDVGRVREVGCRRVFAFLSAGVDMGLSSRTGWVRERNALQVGDVCLVEDGGELGGALDSNQVAPQTVSEEQSGNGEVTQA